MSVAVFGYASLVSAESAATTLGRDRPVPLRPARLHGWRRRWTQARDNLASEKTFALADGSLPSHVLGLNVERGQDPAGPVNGALLEVSEAELERLDLREIRYRRIDVTAEIEVEGRAPESVIVYGSRPANHRPAPPPGAVILETYAAAVEAAFEALGSEELAHYLATTGPDPVERVAATLVRDRAPAGNPREW